MNCRSTGLRLLAVSSYDAVLESGIGRKEILDLDGLGISSTNEDLWEYTLADDEVGREGLVRDIDNGRGPVVDGDPG